MDAERIKYILEYCEVPIKAFCQTYGYKTGKSYWTIYNRLDPSKQQYFRQWETDTIIEIIKQLSTNKQAIEEIIMILDAESKIKKQIEKETDPKVKKGLKIALTIIQQERGQ